MTGPGIGAEFRRQAACPQLLGHLVPALRAGDAISKPVGRGLRRARDSGIGNQRGFERTGVPGVSAEVQTRFRTVREARIHRDYGTFMYPETYIVDSTGKVLRKYEEALDWSSADVRSYLDSLL